MYRLLLTLLLALSLPIAAEEVRELTWSEMVPEQAKGQNTQPAPVMHDLSQLSDVLSEANSPAAAQQSPAAPVVKALDGQSVKLPGYIVPIEMDEDGKVSEFLLVPYFGACIHVPPPPSNQIVLVRYPDGVLLDELYQPFWIEGPLQVQAASSELAEAGYQMSAARVYPYE